MGPMGGMKFAGLYQQGVHWFHPFIWGLGLACRLIGASNCRYCWISKKGTTVITCHYMGPPCHPQFRMHRSSLDVSIQTCATFCPLLTRMIVLEWSLAGCGARSQHYTPPCKLDCHHIGYNSSRCICQFSLPSVNLLVVAQVSFGPAMVQDRIDEEQVEPQHMSRGTSRTHRRFLRANSLYISIPYEVLRMKTPLPAFQHSCLPGIFRRWSPHVLNQRELRVQSGEWRFLSCFFSWKEGKKNSPKGIWFWNHISWKTHITSGSRWDKQHIHAKEGYDIFFADDCNQATRVSNSHWLFWINPRRERTCNTCHGSFQLKHRLKQSLLSMKSIISNLQFVGVKVGRTKTRYTSDYTSEVSHSPLKNGGLEDYSPIGRVTFQGLCLISGVYSDVSLFPLFHNRQIWNIQSHFEGDLWRQQNRLLNLRRYHQWIIYFLLEIGFLLVNIGNTCKQCDSNK